MNTGDKTTYPIDPAAEWPEDGETAWLRVKRSANGVLLADEGERAIGHLESGIAPEDPNGRNEACVYLISSGGTHFAVAAETLQSGDGFVGADDGRVKKEPDLDKAEGQVFQGGSAGSQITITYFRQISSGSASGPQLP